MTSNQLCQLAADWKGKALPFGSIVEQKIDGWRALFLRDVEGTPSLFTRNGCYIHGAEHIIHQCLHLERLAGQPLFIDGEFQVDFSLEATKHWCETGWKMGGTAGRLFVFDCVPLSEWQAGCSSMKLTDRRTMLARLFAQSKADEEFHWDWRAGSFGQDEGRESVTLLPYAWAFDASEVLDMANAVWQAGGEGVMVKDPDAPYQRNRNRAWQKVKQGQAWQRRA